MQEVDTGEMLLVIHHYLMSLGLDEICRRGARDEENLKLVKSILHELCRLKASSTTRH